MLPSLRLFQLISPSLPVGAFTYSQGLEWAIEAGWVNTAAELQEWLRDVLQHSVATLELPVLARLYHACASADAEQLDYWSTYLYASRETAELRAEERQRGKALAVLLPALQVDIPASYAAALQRTQLAGMALAAHRWQIPLDALCSGYLWSWLENSVMAGVKLVPLGQTQGQQLLLSLSEILPALQQQALQTPNADVAGCTPALAIASAQHETQYTRLFRS
ncbi:Urease accessory protein UreF [Nitrincola lacisaponensis]|uniref:Urease accessory protein UreF n=1 Tax=Nitrincola lacisaponensis TaxID=267850 RepID=A0A063Y3D7_9GAMM|nr:urease accessory protein UreF [Nitrincola lacisaponensis]KDE40204.1 Urease accessory protein UreF [Nitrincola lacisaponensis]